MKKRDKLDSVFEGIMSSNKERVWIFLLSVAEVAMARKRNAMDGISLPRYDAAVPPDLFEAGMEFAKTASMDYIDPYNYIYDEFIDLMKNKITGE